MTSPLRTRAPTPPAARPTDTGERLHVLDVLRGLALLGMILVHFHDHTLDLDGVDGLVRTATWRLVESKSHGTFALLFGAGFALQLRHATARGTPFARTYLRRLLVLALFGFAAHALCGFNVLLGYAAWGVPLLLIRSWSTRALVALAVAASLSGALFWLLLGSWESAMLGSDGALAAQQARHAAAAQVNGDLDVAVAQSDYSLLLSARLHHMAWFYRQPFFWLPGATLILFAAGMLAVRHRLFEDARAHPRALAGAIAFGVVAWAAANWLPPAFCGFGLLRDQWLTFAYVGGALLLFARWPRWLELLRPVGQAGRMALTNYLLQIAVLDLLFSGYALHLAPVRPLAGVGLTLLLFGVEVALSRAWLARFRFGPAEWAWRSLTYGRLQPMRR